MKVIATSIFLSAAFFSLQASAEVALNLGDCIQTHVVNGIANKAKAGSTLTLSNGVQQVVVDCTVAIGGSGEDSYFETTDAFVLRFDAQNTELSLTAPRIRNSQQLDGFNSKGNFRLVSASGEAVQYQAEVLKKEGFQVFRDYAREVEVFNRSSSPAAIRFITPVVAETASDAREGQHDSSDQGTPDQEMVNQMLRYWYLKGDRKTRSEWKNWINSSN